ncbi:MAG: protein kinase [Verrucomicrobia bacterium]|nr:protein kinase [Verrucomicrobiota bacterium]
MAEQMIARYRILRRLGVGGMGEVLLAEDTRLERSVALKLMSAELAKNENQRKRFHTEAKAASALNHPNICVIHEVGETEDGRPFLAMEYVEGQTLDVVLQQRRLKIREVLALGAQVADALDAAHARGLLHRDIKPANIMLDRRGQAKVLDFGLAKRFGNGASAVSNLSTADTQTGFLVGTPHYMSPEQALGGELDRRSDVFALGVVLYELVAGQKPFLGKTVGETINKIINQQPDSLGLENPLFSPTLDGIIFKCLEKDPAKRYATAKALAEDLNKLRHESERASAPGVEPAAPVATSPSKEPRAEPTKLWQLAAKSDRHEARHVMRLVLGTVLVIAAIAAAGWFVASTRSTRLANNDTPTSSSVSALAQKSVAVLPFDNFSAEKDTEYLSDGLTEEITTALSRLPGLKVVARNSAFAFKGRKEDLRKVGAALGVTTILEGSLRKAGRQLRVTAQLINVADGYHLWSETYDRSVDDIFAVQEDIARRIAERLQVEIAGGAQPASHQTAIAPEAHTLYLRGRHFWNERGKDNLEKAVQLFRQAIDKAPTYAAAHAGLASAYAVLPGYSLRPEREYLPLAKAAAVKALELDAESVEAHCVLAHTRMQAYDFKSAEEEFRRAIQINANDATVHHWYGLMLRELGRTDEGLHELRRAEELDPLSPIIKANLIYSLVYARKTEEALSQCQQAVQVFPNFPMLHATLGWLYLKNDQPRQAVAEVTKVRELEKDSPVGLDMLAYVCARAGDPARARRALAEMETWLQKGYAMHGLIAVGYLGLREYDRALDNLEEAFAANESLFGLLNDPVFDDIRSHPRFQALIRKCGLKP